jgi:RHS repeat-associated protein
MSYDAAGNGNVKGQYWYDDQGFRVRRVAQETVNGRDREVEILYPSMYYGVEVQRTRGTVDPNSGLGVNNIYLNGVRIAAALPNCQARYYLTDQVDSVKVVTNDAGLVVTSHEYLPFGEDWITEGDTKNAPKYNSQELDKESGYYFYNARHYDPEIGRFVTADTVIDGELSTQGWNRYSYVHNNPIIYKDPTGHAFQLAPVLAFAKGLVERGVASGVGEYAMQVAGNTLSYIASDDKNKKVSSIFTDVDKRKILIETASGAAGKGVLKTPVNVVNSIAKGGLHAYDTYKETGSVGESVVKGLATAGISMLGKFGTEKLFKGLKDLNVLRAGSQAGQKDFRLGQIEKIEDSILTKTGLKGLTKGIDSLAEKGIGLNP